MSHYKPTLELAATPSGDVSIGIRTSRRSIVAVSVGPEYAREVAAALVSLASAAPAKPSLLKRLFGSGS